MPIWIKDNNQWHLDQKILNDDNFIEQIKGHIAEDNYAFIRQDSNNMSIDECVNLSTYEKFMDRIMQDSSHNGNALIEYGPKTGDFCVLDRPLYPGTKHIYKTGIDTLNLSRQHNELGYGDVWPKYISFLCVTPPLVGQGITTLTSGADIAQELKTRNPQLMRKLLNEGVQYIQIYLSDASKRHECAIQGPEDYCHVAPTWRHAFGTDDIDIAIQRCKQQGGWDHVELIENDNIVVSRVRPVFLEIDQVTTYFNAIVGFSKRPFRSVTFGNGDMFTSEEINLLEDIQQSSLRGMAYQKGDILIVDNEKMMHGRSVRNMLKPREIAVTKGCMRRRVGYV